MPKLDRRTKVVLTVAGVAAVVANAGAAWAYWHVTGTGTAVAEAGTVVELGVHASTAQDQPLYPGATSDLRVTVTNDNDFPVRVTSVARGTGATVADAAHRAAGCHRTGVAVSRAVQPVSWEVPGDTAAVFTLTDGVTMTNESDSACQGATFTIAVQATGVSAAS